MKNNQDQESKPKAIIEPL